MIGNEMNAIICMLRFVDGQLNFISVHLVNDVQELLEGNICLFVAFRFDIIEEGAHNLKQPSFIWML